MTSSRTPTSPPLRANSRTPSLRSQNVSQFTPTHPSGLRESFTLATSPEATRHVEEDGTNDRNDENSRNNNGQPLPHAHPARPDTSASTDDGLDGHTGFGGKLSDETTALLRKPFESSGNAAHSGPCNHGTFSPRLGSRADSVRSFGGSAPVSPNGNGEASDGMIGGLLKGLGVRSGPMAKPKRMSTTSWLAEQHGITNTTGMYINYYIPFFTWIRQYRWVHLRGDLIAAITMASFYLPMALSYASNLAHVPPINGLYAFVFNPLIYAIFGSCPQMVVGPEAAGSLLVGTVVKSTVDIGNGGEEDDLMHARVAGIVTGMAGAVIFIAGLTRLGFLDSVLSRPFLRGFISAIGFVIMVDQLIPEMGLAALADEMGGVAHGSSVDKLGFLIRNASKAHKLTCVVAGVSFIIIMIFREMKKRLQPRYPSVAYIPDRFLVVVISAILAWQYNWEDLGVQILGEVKSTGGAPFTFRWPFQISHMKHVRESMGTSFLIALLGFFESSVAAKSLAGAEGKDMIQGVQLSPNRELVALGVANLVGGCFQAVPAFGGYGRSKVNASTGGKTPMSSIFLSLLTVLCIMFLLPAFYYLPKAVLSSMITVVAYSLIEEAPHDIAFFIRILGLSLLSVIKHSTRPRIQILGRIPGTNRFENAEDNPEKLEFIEGCLIVKIPEPLTFANTGDLKNRLRRLELYGTNNAHPALPRVRSPEHNKNIIFDIHGVTGLDGSGTQVLEEIVRGYRNRGVRVFFSRGPQEGTHIWKLLERSGILETCGGREHFVKDVEEALRLTETAIDPDAINLPHDIAST
ncbi:sulfate transporter [Botrytis cinerea]